jgi:hypothetical protein
MQNVVLTENEPYDVTESRIRPQHNTTRMKRNCSRTSMKRTDGGMRKECVFSLEIRRVRVQERIVATRADAVKLAHVIIQALGCHTESRVCFSSVSRNRLSVNVI